jgi:Rad3-related DNA helicase
MTQMLPDSNIEHTPDLLRVGPEPLEDATRILSSKDLPENTLDEATRSLLKEAANTDLAAATALEAEARELCGTYEAYKDSVIASGSLVVSAQVRVALAPVQDFMARESSLRGLGSGTELFRRANIAAAALAVAVAEGQQNVDVVQASAALTRAASMVGDTVMDRYVAPSLLAARMQKGLAGISLRPPRPSYDPEDDRW